MKTAIHTLPQFSGYPPIQVAASTILVRPASIIPIKKEEKKEQASVYHLNANDPANWDAEWFGNYE